MKRKKIYILIIIAWAIGIFIGWLLFRGNASHELREAGVLTTGTSETIWTCSMHPQVRQNESGKCPICGMDLIPVKQTSADSDMAFQMTEEAIKLANIQTTVIQKERQVRSSMLKLSGKIQADETKSASLVTHIPGRIEQLFVNYTGEQVTKGQKIAAVYSPELMTAQEELLEAQKVVDISPDFLAAAKKKLTYWRINDHVIDNILSTKVIREKFDIYAEHAGTVEMKRVAVGDHLSMGEVLFDIQNLNSLWALFDVYENDLPKIKIGQMIGFTTPSIPRKTYRAKVTFVNPLINPKTRVVTIRAEVHNTGGQLKPEMFITGKLSTTQKATKLTVPKSAVLWTGRRSVVYVKTPNTKIPSYEYREVKLGQSTEEGYVVVNGLTHGEVVVTNGAFVIDASAQLNNRASMMNKRVVAKTAKPFLHLPDYVDEAPKAFKQSLSNLAIAYLSVKDALVEDDSQLAATVSRKVLSTIEQVDMSLLKGKAHMFWMDQVKAIKAHSAQIAKLTSIVDQREQFDFLSQVMIKVLKVFGVEKGVFYVQHCPMANNNAGAKWLSKQENIRNPYFGDQMLTCGSVKDTINIHFRNPPARAQSTINNNIHHH